MKKFIIILTALIISTPVFSQQFPEKQIKAGSLLTIEVKVEDKIADDRGTDVTNMRVFTITATSPESTTQGNFSVVYFLDGAAQKQIDNITFPFSFEQDYKGIEGGTHNAQFVIEDGTTFEALAQKEVSFNVIK